MKIWILLISVLILLVILVTIVAIVASKRIKNYSTSISFKEGMDLLELPVITVSCGDTKLHFLLDTGSNVSYINKDILSSINCTETNKRSKVIGMEGNPADINHFIIKFKYKDNIFEEEFGAANLTQAFMAIKEECGVEIHGILGSKFFERYKYILDFKELTAYR